MAGKKQKLCRNGHEVSVCGRDKDGKCKQCRRERHLATYKPHPKITPQFCVNGHDTLIVGRYDHGSCIQCAKDRSNQRYTLHPAPLKQFCPKGHDTFVTGRNTQGRCRACGRRGGRKGPEPKQFCKHGHDISIVGRGKDRICNACKVVLAADFRIRHREEIKIKDKKYRLEHPEKVAANRLKQETNRGLRIPKWADWDKINEFERNKPSGMTTDHIIPLQGDSVSGFHVSWNLQPLTHSENAKKHNACDLLEISEWYGQILQQAGLK